MELVNYNILSIKKVKFENCDINDVFFDSLKKDYPDFLTWFMRKKDENAYVHYNNGIQGFLYLKEESENEDYSNMEIPLSAMKRMKIGTFKITDSGFNLGERFFKIIFENAIRNNLEEIYVTIYSHHTRLIKYFKMFGFIEKTKILNTGEIVFVRNLNSFEDNQYLGYPLLNIKNKDFYLLPIRPEYHTNLLPDAILKTEDNNNFLINVKPSNTLKKVYFGKNLWAYTPKKGDIILFYRTKDNTNPAPGNYQSVLTSIGVVNNYGNVSELTDNQLINYLSKCVLDNNTKNKIYENVGGNYKFVEFIYYGKFDVRKINLSYLRSLGYQAPRGLKIIDRELGEKIIYESEYKEGIVIKE